jgi:hypothetical protein
MHRREQKSFKFRLHLKNFQMIEIQYFKIVDFIVLPFR